MTTYTQKQTLQLAKTNMIHYQYGDLELSKLEPKYAHKHTRVIYFDRYEY